MVDALKKYKRGLSDSLFAHISQSSDCKLVKLGDAFELLQNNTFSREDLTSGLSSVQNIHYGDVLIKYGAVVNIAEDKPPYIKPDIELKKFCIFHSAALSRYAQLIIPKQSVNRTPTET